MDDVTSGTARNYEGKVALITGGAQGLGAGVAQRLADLGAKVVIADMNAALGERTAADAGGIFIKCDVSSYDDCLAAVGAAEMTYGGLDIAILNAGVTSGLTMGESFDANRYRKVMGVNLDGVVFGFNAALPAIRRRGSGDVIVTASMAGLAPVPFDPIYAANKTAIVGLVRSLGVAHIAEGIKVNAVCPAFTNTDLLGEMRAGLEQAGVPLLTVAEVVDVFFSILNSEGAGECWYVQPGRPSEPFGFRRAPGPRRTDGSIAPAADAETQLKIEADLRSGG